MDPFALRAAFRVAILVLIAALVMLPFQPPASAEFVVTALAAFIFVGVVALLTRLSGSRPPKTVDRARGLRSNVRNGRSGREE